MKENGQIGCDKVQTEKGDGVSRITSGGERTVEDGQSVGKEECAEEADGS